jgi:hypothetical protein
MADTSGGSMGVPPNHPFYRISHIINHPVIGVPVMETSTQNSNPGDLATTI